VCACRISAVHATSLAHFLQLMSLAVFSGKHKLEGPQYGSSDDKKLKIVSCLPLLKIPGAKSDRQHGSPDTYTDLFVCYLTSLYQLPRLSNVERNERLDSLLRYCLPNTNQERSVIHMLVSVERVLNVRLGLTSELSVRNSLNSHVLPSNGQQLSCWAARLLRLLC
jgi:hypothetical protein